MVIQEHYNDLVVGTYGRGFWIMDDITPLQQLTDEVLRSEAHLFQPRPAYRLHRKVGGPYVFPYTFINYYLKDVPEGPVKITITDDQGRQVNTLMGSVKKGINRVYWNMRYQGAQQAKLRTKPPGNPHVVEEKRFHKQWEEQGWYPIQSWGSYGGFRGFGVYPGDYTVKMTVGEEEFVETLVVKKDPSTEGTADDIKAQVALQMDIRRDLNAVSEMINKIEWIRKQIYDIKDMIKKSGDKSMLQALDEFDKKCRSVEDELFQPILAEGDSKSFRNPQKLYCKLSVLAEDVSKLTDFAPNKQQLEVLAGLKERLAVQKKRFQDLVENDFTAINTLLTASGLPVIFIYGGRTAATID